MTGSKRSFWRVSSIKPDKIKSMLGLAARSRNLVSGETAVEAAVKSGKAKPNLVEGMACPGGCVGGPGTLIGIAAAQAEVKKFANEAPDRIPS